MSRLGSETRRVTRRSFLRGASATSFGLLLAACSGNGDDSGQGSSDSPPTPTPSPPSEERRLKDGLAEGKWGGPVGFQGAERYQYEFESEEGRAIRALQRMVRDGRAPERLVVQVLDLAKPHVLEPFLEGAPSMAQVFEEETGIKIETITTTVESNLTESREAIVNEDGSFDVVQTTAADIGDLAQGGLLRPLDDFVETHQPSWSHPRLGYAGGEPAVRRSNTFAGRFYVVSMDNGAPPFAYRIDLMLNQDERAVFEEAYGRPLVVPRTWEEHADVAAFFTRKDKEPPLFGDVSLRSPIWQIATWQQRFVSSAAPSMFYFNDDGSANIGGDSGIRATEEHVKAAEWGGPDVLNDVLGNQYESFGSCGGATGSSFPTITKLLPGNPEYDTANCGRFVALDLTPGRVVDGELIRRPVIFGSVAWGVNVFAEPSRQEAAYLFLQWAGGARTHAWSVRHPAGVMNPLHNYSFQDPAVIASYSRGAISERGETSAEVLRRITPFAAPPIRIRGAAEYREILDLELQRTLAGQKPPQDAIRDAAEQWNALTEELGLESQAAAIEADRAVWPTLTET